MRITLAQAFLVWTCWNLGFHCIGSLGRWLPFLVQGPMVFNVPHISEPCQECAAAFTCSVFLHVFTLCASACIHTIHYFMYFYVTIDLGMYFDGCAVPHPKELWYGALCKLAKTDSHSRSIKTRIIGSLLWLLRCWTDTPRLFQHLSTRYNVPTILFIANDSTSVKKCCSYKGVNAVQTDYPNKFLPIFQHT